MQKHIENSEVFTIFSEPLNLPNLPNEGQKIVSLLESKKKLKLCDKTMRIECSNKHIKKLLKIIEFKNQLKRFCILCTTL